ncbi:MAG: uracil-xanthine permease family protein [Eubacteriales bacterium]|nr:uracil-xanthine permease family protein [Eubacteriales bacterium]
MDNTNVVIRDAKKLGVPKMLLLGLQHMFAMFGATILVPILVNSYFQSACGEPLTKGLTVSVTLFCAGCGTLLFHLCAKMMVPAFLGSSFAFLGGFATVANLSTGIYKGMGANEKAAYACGGVVVAGLLYLVLALIIRLVGVKRVMRYLPPVVTGPVIICIGLSLASSAISNASTNWFLALVALAVIIVFNIWGKGMFKIIPILMGVVISYAVAVIMNASGLTNPDGSAIIDFAAVASAGFVGLPPLQICKFDVTSILVMAPIAIATMMEHIGDMSAISATVGENFLAEPGLHRTLMGDGLATSFAGLIGGPANTTYGENTGVLELSHVYDPLVIRIAAVFAIIISFIPKVSAIISTMPSSIIGGVSFMLYGMISAIGVRNVVENRVDLTKSRNLIIAGVIFVCGLGFGDGLTFHIGGASITLTALAIAAIAGIALNIILPGNDYEFGVNLQGDINRGVNMNSGKEGK